jgi:hypothetical protein
MKIRTGFVSNSSSSSFLIERKYITDEQWDLIINRKEKFRDVFMKFVVIDAYDNIQDEKLSCDNLYEYRELLFYLIKHLEEGKKEDEFFKDIDYNCWNIIEKKDSYNKIFHKGFFKADDPEDTVLFQTYIANFDMQMYLQMIGVDIRKIFREGE